MVIVPSGCPKRRIASLSGNRKLHSPDELSSFNMHNSELDGLHPSYLSVDTADWEWMPDGELQTDGYSIYGHKVS